MNKCIVYTNDDKVNIIYPTSEMFNEKSRTRFLLKEQGIELKNDEEILNWIAKKDVPNNLPYRICDISNVPNDRTFRDAWTDEYPTETVDINIDKAKKIHMDRIRHSRNKKLKDLDLIYMKADENNDINLKKEIAAKKQALRDLPGNFDLNQASTCDHLKNLWPEELGTPQ